MLFECFGDKCVDKVHNLVRAESNTASPRPAMISDVSGTVYNKKNQPSCYNERPTVVLPGVVKFLSGQVTVPKKYDLIKSGYLLLTVRGMDYDDPLCLNGVSQYFAIPDDFCRLKLCDFIGEDVCRVVQEPGTHTFKELEKKINFNTTQLLPEPPSLLGISLLDLFAGEFGFHFQVETEGEIVLEVTVPTNDKFLQIGVTDD
uniref:Uncharacterized protein n=2 Tax=Acrobeloides nanus TaxID=290746 RepID=A0A914D8N5_9BILA